MTSTQDFKKPARTAEAERALRHSALNVCYDLLIGADFRIGKNTEYKDDVYYTIALYMDAMDKITAMQEVQRINRLVTGYATATYFPNSQQIIIK